jgi:hypothetical protein
MKNHKMGRPLHKHLDNRELGTLVPWCDGAELENRGLLCGSARLAQSHVDSCADCRDKVSRYRQIVSRTLAMPVSKLPPRGSTCPTQNDVDWGDIVAGLWPALEARALIMHAAFCHHCGPLLRAAVSAANDPTHLKKRSLPALPLSGSIGLRMPRRSSHWWAMRWLAPAALLLLAALLTRRPTPTPLSGPQFAEFAVATHGQRTQGRLVLDIQTGSQQTLNAWLKSRSPFFLVLPAAPPAPGELRPYRLEGARLLQIGNETADFIAYQVQTPTFQAVPSSLIVAPASAAVASGGTEAHFKKVTFHYSTVGGYKVVIWSVHGLTYALVSREGNGTQRSCMICHSPMRDRDLSDTLTPLLLRRGRSDNILQ